MSASAADKARIRRMTNEPTTTIYDDTLIGAYIEAWPLVDENGKTAGEDGWIVAYDLHAAAADIWDEKAAARADKHDYSADGASYSSDQMYQNAIAQARYHRARQKAKVKVMINKPVSITNTVYPLYSNPIFDEDEPHDWIDLV